MKNILYSFLRVENKFAKITGIFSTWLLMSLFAFPILPLQVTNILFINFSGFTMLSWALSGRPSIWKSWGRNMILAIPFIPYIIEFIFFHDNAVAGFELEKKLLFFTAPLAFAFYTSASKPLSFRIYAKIFSWSLILLSIYSLILLIIKGILFSPSNYEGDASVLRIKFEDISGLHPTYFGFFACISILWIIYDFKNLSTILKWITVFSGGILIFVNFLIAAKMSLIILFLASLFLIYKITTRKKYLLVTFTITGAIFFALLLLIPSLRERTFELKDLFGSTGGIYNSVNERKIIFVCSWEIFERYFWVGTGCRNMQQNLNILYWIVQFWPGVLKNYNSHNQFLTLGINYGIFDVLLFITSIILVIRNASENIFAIILIGSTVLIMLTESILERQMGVYFFVLFMLVLYNMRKKELNQV